MKKIFMIGLLLAIPALIILNCTPIPTPDVEIVDFFALGTYVDSTQAMSGSYYLTFDDTKLVVRNNEKTIIDGAYVEIYQVTDTSHANDRFIRRGDVIHFTTQMFGEWQNDTIPDTLTISGLKADVTPEAESLWVDKNIQSYRIDLHFTGEDAYGYHKRFDILRTVSLLRALK